MAAPQLCPQAPQLLASVARFAQLPPVELQSASPWLAQLPVQTPLLHTCEAEHTCWHAPQS